MGGPDDDDDDGDDDDHYNRRPPNNPYEERLVSATYKPETPVHVDGTLANYDTGYWTSQKNTPESMRMSDEKRISQPIRPIISDDSFMKNFKKSRERQQELKEQ